MRNENVVEESSKTRIEKDVGKEQCQSDDTNQKFGDNDTGKKPKFNFLRGQKHKQRASEEGPSIQRDIPEEDSSKRYKFSTKHSKSGQKQNKKFDGQAVVPYTILRRERFYFWPPNPQISHTETINKQKEKGSSSIEMSPSDMDVEREKALHKTKTQ